MKNILFCGDSITRGQLGDSYIKDLSLKYHCINKGCNGDTFRVIVQKLLDHIATTHDYDYLVLQGGYNDILLPDFLNRDRWYQFAYGQQIKKGIIAITGEDELHTFLQSSIQSIKKYYQGKIIITTIGCIGEQLSSSLNKQRLLYNGIIREIAAAENLLLADTALLFEQLLANNISGNYCMDSFWNVSFLDACLSAILNTNYLSKKRRLQLTIDGVHLNQKGAALFTKSIMEQVEQ